MRFILLLLIVTKFSACTHKSIESKFYSSLISKEWALEVHDKYWSLPLLTMTEEKVLIDSLAKTCLNKEFGPSYYLHVLNFKPDGKIEFSRKIKSLALCGNGIMEINSGTWQLDNDLLLIDIEGTYTMESKFHYKIEYLISFPKENEMVLTKKKSKLWEVEKHEN